MATENDDDHHSESERLEAQIDDLNRRAGAARSYYFDLSNALGHRG